MIVLWVFALIYITWIFYLAVMNLKRAKDNGDLSLIVKVLGYPLLYVGLILDFLTNIIFCTILFLEFPKETLVTARLKRHIKTEGWRKNIAAWVCKNLLNQFDPSGCHC